MFLLPKHKLGHKKVNYMFLRHRPRHFQPPRIKNFYCIPTDKCEKSTTRSELTVQSGCYLPCLWLVKFWCTRPRDSAPLIKSQNFYGTSSEHRFYSQKVKKK